MKEFYNIHGTNDGDVLTPWRGGVIGGVNHPHDILTKWSEADLNKIGLHKAVAADPIPDGEERISVATKLIGGVPKLVHQTRVVTAADLDEKRNLTPARFAYLLAITGLEQVWTAVEAHCFETNDLATYALLKAHGKAGEFRLTKTLATLATMKPLTDAVAPGVDLSEATIRAAWAQAEAAVI